MPRINEWVGANRIGAPLAETRAASVWAWIQRKPDTITVIREGTGAMAAQTVRIEFNSPSATALSSDSGKAAKRQIVIFGIQGHPSENDTDLQRGDRFKYYSSSNLVNYRIIAVDKVQIGQVQAVAEEIQ